MSTHNIIMFLWRNKKNINAFGLKKHLIKTVSMVREKVREKNFFSRSGNCQGILKFVTEFWHLS